MKKFPWESDPEIGFWMDNDPIRLYFGTILSPDFIGRNGLSSKRWVSLSLDPYTALNIVTEGHIMVIEVPARWLMDHMDQRLHGNKKDQQERLLSRDSFLQWKRMDFEYYAGTEIHIVNQVPSRYIVGYIQHH